MAGLRRAKLRKASKQSKWKKKCQPYRQYNGNLLSKAAWDFSLLSGKRSWMLCPLSWDGGIATGDIGTAAVFEMNFTAFPIVLEIASEPDMSAGEAGEGFFCVFRKALAE